MEVASDLEEFEPFDDGNYFVLYNQNMKLEQGALPSGFDINAGFESGKIVDVYLFPSNLLLF